MLAERASQTPLSLGEDGAECGDRFGHPVVEVVIGQADTLPPNRSQKAAALGHELVAIASAVVLVRIPFEADLPCRPPEVESNALTVRQSEPNLGCRFRKICVTQPV